MDATDLALLDQLQEDSSLSNLELAAKVHISPRDLPAAGEAAARRRPDRARIAILDPERLAPPAWATGWKRWSRFRWTGRATRRRRRSSSASIADDAVQQCYRVSPGPDFVLVVHARDMPDYLALAQRLFTSDANVRNVKAFFSVRRAKFRPRIPLPRGTRG